MKKILTLLLLLPVLAFGQVVVINDASIQGGQGDVFWTADNEYHLDGFVYVEEGTNLHIEAGTVIKGLETPSTGDIASALIITRGAKIYAIGTADNPIIFTTEYDDVTLPDDGTDPGVDYTIDTGLWGGLVVLGKSTLNVAAEKVVEGLPADEPRALYGGNDEEDDSGVLRYISIRYSGITVESNKELQGLTLGCVGSGTTIEYIESFNSADDGFEFFGGTFNSKYLVSAFNEDDSFDYDQGFRGMHQFWFAIQYTDRGDHIGEWDGGDEGALTNEPLSKPIIYNATFLGRGAAASGGDDALQFKEYGGGEVYNSIISDFDDKGVEVDSGDGLTSYSRFLTGEIKLENNIWFKDAPFTQWTPQHFMAQYLSNPTTNNLVEDPMLLGLSRAADNGLDPRPEAGSAAFTGTRKSYDDPFFSQVDYIGAFGEGLWINGWTALYHNGITNPIITSVQAEDERIIPTDFKLNQNYPNPFNPSTTIEFSLPEASIVKIAVYNLLGQQVAEIVNETKSAGTHSMQWNASDLSSGMYIYSLEANGNIITKKMTLLK